MPMNSLFVDTSGWASYFHAGDPFHDEAVRIYVNAYNNHYVIYTTDHVLAELVALLASRHYKLPRPAVIAVLNTILNDERITIVPTDWQHFIAAWQLLEQHQDKGWSLVDAISFKVMERHEVLDALTSDEHFDQAHRIRLLK